MLEALILKVTNQLLDHRVSFRSVMSQFKSLVLLIILTKALAMKGSRSNSVENLSAFHRLRLHDFLFNFISSKLTFMIYFTIKTNLNHSKSED